uniref:ARAD1C23254p n=1 Tax=Blastobotrys adeninivorans TaxID=409370 RepID=A0A060T282_BLAAD
MKFAFHLKEELVPEWRDQYLDYKGGKKLLKRIVRNETPIQKPIKPPKSADTDGQAHSSQVLHRSLEGLSQRIDASAPSTTKSPIELPPPALTHPPSTPNKNSATTSSNDSSSTKTPFQKESSDISIRNQDTSTTEGSENSQGPDNTQNSSSKLVNDKSPLLNSPREGQKSGRFSVRTPYQSILASPTIIEKARNRKDAEDQFLKWVDDQIDKIDKFYSQKEQEAVERFLLLQDQLIRLINHKQRIHNRGAIDRAAKSTISVFAKKVGLPSLPVLLQDKFSSSKRCNSEEHLSTVGPVRGTQPSDDYVRHDDDMHVVYSAAKRQLKVALSEYYRSLELLKGYRALNQTAVRKIVKKFDKLANRQESEKYTKKVADSYFSKSDVLENLSNKTEEMFAKYFENSNRKSAIEKLRAKEFAPLHYRPMLSAGLWIGLSIPLFIQAIYVGIKHLSNGTHPDTEYLFQVWGGFFIVNLILMLFSLNLWIWSKFKINYPFIFEFDQRHSLDVQQYPELPAFLLFLMSLFGWLTFNDFFQEYPAKYFPPIYLGIAVVVWILPFPIIYWRSRKWLLVACWRLLLSGLYPVEFRDFFLGDIFCSLNYSLSNASFFFCLYATHWEFVYPGSPKASRCSSQRSRLLGFLNCLPGIWRFLQCLRRFGDTGDWFPHLANAAKYSCLILYYMFLSLMRIDRGQSDALRAVFITFAAINAIYSSFWDLVMDFSLGQMGSKHFMLRDELAFGAKWPYYTIMVIDPIMRFSWVLYAVFSRQIQQSAKISFIVALIEIVRRFLWVFFRVENEHCSNVVRMRATRDLVLPYSVYKKEKDEEEAVDEPLLIPRRSQTTQEPEGYHGSPGRRDTFASIATPVLRAVSAKVRSAHTADFQRKTVVVGEEDEEEDDDDDLEDDHDVTSHTNSN